MMRAITGTLAGITLATLLTAATPPQRQGGAAVRPLPAAVAADLKAMADRCRAATGAPGSPGNAVERTDINRDGLTDYIVYSGGYDCPGTDVLQPRIDGAGVPSTLYLGERGGTARAVWTQVTWGWDSAEDNRRYPYDFQMLDAACAGLPDTHMGGPRRRSCELTLRPDAAGKWGLHPPTGGRRAGG